jgi:hypothetical protein
MVSALAFSRFLYNMLCKIWAARGTDRTAENETKSVCNKEEGRKDPITGNGLRQAKASQDFHCWQNCN